MTPAASSWVLWRDGRGRVSPLRIIALAGLLWPAVLALGVMWIYGLGARPLNDLIHRTGFWALVFLLVSLAITPLSRVARFGQVLDVRRMIGVGAFSYAAMHVLLYIADLRFNLMEAASEIVLRLYLTVGFVALLGLAVLAITSTDGMVRRLGGRTWTRLHQLSYLIALLAIIHFFQQTKLDVTIPTFVAGLFAWLMGYRLFQWYRGSRKELPTAALLVLTVVVSVLVFAVEAGAIAIAFGVSPWMVLQTATDFEYTIRPGWNVLAAGLAVVALDLVRLLWLRATKTSGSNKRYVQDNAPLR